MRCACQYAIIRFMPFIETGEFANVGIVLLCPEKRFFGFKLLKRHGRLTRFFKNMEARIYTDSRTLFHDELTRILALLKSGPFDDRRRKTDIPAAQALFGELVRPREVIMRFDAPRAVLSDNPDSKLDELYRFYVERDFVTKLYQTN